MRHYSPWTVIFYLLGPALILFSHAGSFLLLTTGLSWGAMVWIVWWYAIRMLATTGVYHRLLTHRSCRVHPLVLGVGCVIAAAAGQMGPSWWKAHHLAHHQYADHNHDPHSPWTPARGLRGFCWSQGGWLLSSQFFPAKLPRDVESDPFLRLLDRLHFIPTIALGAISYMIGGAEYFGAFCLSTALLFHGVQTVNSLSHIAGEQPFDTTDNSRNNRLVACLTLGEGWHNLHHAFPASSRHGITIRDGKVFYLPDPTYRFLKLLEVLSLASKPKVPNEGHLLSRARKTTLLISELPITVKATQQIT